jgi:hypothetical protein
MCEERPIKMVWILFNCRFERIAELTFLKIFSKEEKIGFRIK